MEHRLCLRRIRLSENTNSVEWNFCGSEQKKSFPSSFDRMTLFCCLVRKPARMPSQSTFRTCEYDKRSVCFATTMSPPPLRAVVKVKDEDDDDAADDSTFFFYPSSSGLNCNCCLSSSSSSSVAAASSWHLRFRSHYFHIETETDDLIGRNRFAWMNCHRCAPCCVAPHEIPNPGCRLPARRQQRWKSISCLRAK